MNDPLTIICGDALSALRAMPAESVQCVVTSPPYWSLRDYGIEPLVWDDTVECEHDWTGETRQAERYTGKRKWQHIGVEAQAAGVKVRDVDPNAWGHPQKSDTSFCAICGAWRGCLGLEPAPELFVQHIVQIFRELRRVLRKDGTLWLNLGDSYSNDTKWGGSSGGKNYTSAAGGYQGQRVRRGKDCDPKRGSAAPGQPMQQGNSGLKPKNLVGIPWMVAFALRADGWWLRSDIIWSKPNPMPESVTDRPTRAHEYVFLLTKSAKYFYDAEAIKEPIANSSVQRINQPNFENQTGGEKDYGNGTNPNRSARKALENFKNKFDAEPNTVAGTGGGLRGHSGNQLADGRVLTTRNKRSVWEIPTAPFPEAHFATFPTALVTPCILAGCPPRGTLLDPFGGSGTVGKVALELGRRAILIEPKPEYVEMIKRRCQTTLGLAFTPET